MSTIKIMLVDDHEVVRSGYRRLIENTSNIEVVTEAASGEDAYKRYALYQPQVVVMDLSMPGIGGFQAIKKILDYDKKARILVFSVHDNEVFLHRALDNGALGYITKKSASTVMVEAVHQIAQGKPFIGEDVLPYLIKRKDEKSLFEQLSPREFEVFLLLTEGKSVNEISELLEVSAKTVGNHIVSIKGKLGTSNVVELVHLAIRCGFVTVK